MFKVGKKDQPNSAPSAVEPPPVAHIPSSPAPPTPASAPPENQQARPTAMYAQSNMRALTESETLARDIKEGTLNGFVGAGTHLSGEIAFKGMMRVDGHVTGRVMSDGGTLIVSSGGQVDANIDVAIAVVTGTVNGDITANKKIELGRSAKVSGNLQTPALVIEQGAIFEGTCRMQHFKEAQERQVGEAEARGGASQNAPKTGKPPAPQSHNTPGKAEQSK